ncbi:nuclear protein MDM1 isoform X2 [Ascaphus truei]|uniref:nuclear protein MDM1 isoform X2 n=1 Tax=Ascaphus truei TaxID=8439 RepID=UPI003F5A091A
MGNEGWTRALRLCQGNGSCLHQQPPPVAASVRARERESTPHTAHPCEEARTMAVRFKGLSEYDRNFKVKTSDGTDHDPMQISRWAGLRSDELGNTKEPSFATKRRVPYYNPQISKSLQWKGDLDSQNHVNSETEFKTVDPMKLCLDDEKDDMIEEKIQTPDAPRLQKKSRSHSADPVQSADGRSRVKKLSTHVPVDNKAIPEPSKPYPQKETRGFHRALHKKAGLNMVPSHHPLRMSEYSRQFERKSLAENSPLLAAEQVIYNKNHSIPPYKVDAVKTETEYKSQFKGSPPAKGPKLRKDYEEKHIPVYEPQNLSPKRKEIKKKIVEVTARRPKTDISEPGQKQIIERNILKEKLLQQLSIPSKGYRKMKSEYSANFLSPSEYKYRDGAWVRAKQQLRDQDPYINLGSMWFAEVKELREKAEYYRQRAQGTHFSREHLNQILSVNNRLWDVSSDSSNEEHVSNNIKALDLAGLQTSSKNEKIQESHSATKVKTLPPSNTGSLGISDAPTIPVKRRLVWGQNDVTDPTQEIPALRMEDNNAEEADSEENENLEETERYEENAENKEERHTKRVDGTKLNPSDDGSECTSVSSEVRGRLPTPKLKTFGLLQRTHHDLTTPATGGALLVSPTKHKSPTLEEKESPFETHSSPKKPVSKEYLKRKLNKDEELYTQSPPIAGMRTVDPLPLREDLWPSANISNKLSSPVTSNPFNRSPVQKPFVPMLQQWRPSCRIHGALRDPEFQHNGVCKLRGTTFSWRGAALTEAPPSSPQHLN